MTYSLGFRSPSQQEIAADWFQHLVGLATAQRLEDPQDLELDNLAQLTRGLADSATQLLDELPSTDSAAFRIWLGEYLSEAKPQFQILPPEEPWDEDRLRDWLARGRALTRHPFARMTWMPMAHGELVLFYQGRSRALPTAMQDAVGLIVGHRTLAAAALRELAGEADTRRLLLDLLNEGILEAEVAESWA